VPLRWWIGALLFASTVINYIDRQTLSVLAPYLIEEYHWTNTDFATLVIAFRIAYAIMQAVSGRLLDWLGTRRGLTLTVAWYSVAAMLTSLANGLWSFRIFRFLLGCGEAANWPGATKAVGEWFPDRERGWAVALFDSGSAIGAAVAGPLVVFLYQGFGSWRPVFLITGMLGWLWLLAWWKLYHPPSRHPRLSDAEHRLIEEGQSRAYDSYRPSLRDWARLLTVPQTWGIVLVRAVLDPYWFLMSDWFAIYLVRKGFRLEDTLAGFWVPFLAADLGNFFGGGLSSWFIRQGVPVLEARRRTFLLCAPGMLAMAAVTVLSRFPALIACFALAMFCYAACATIYLALPSDLYPSHAVASVSGLSGTGAGIGTIVSTFTIGKVTDATQSFTPIFLGASGAPVFAVLMLVWLVRREVRPRSAP
jgi:ACS family hexuronate transporter-like MFS transporter